MVSNLESVARDDDFQAIVAVFLGGLPTRIDTIQNAAEADDLESLRRGAHQLKGAAGGYGYPELGAAAAVVERNCQEQRSREEMLASVDQLIAECENAIVG